MTCALMPYALLLVEIANEEEFESVFTDSMLFPG
jgi:hypothetical protein